MPNLRFFCLLAMALAITNFSTPRILGADDYRLPDDTELAVTVNLKQIFSSEVVKAQPDAIEEMKDVLGRLATLHTVQRYMQTIGHDAYRDLHSITFVYTGRKEPQLSFFLLKGEFQAGKISDAIKAGSAIRIAKMGTPNVYEFKPRGEKPIQVAVIDPTTLIAATTLESMSAALARDDKAKPSLVKKELSRQLAMRDNPQSVAFIASGAALSRLVAETGISNAEKVAGFIQTLDVISGGFTLAKGIRFQLACSAENDETAKKLTESTNGGLKILLTLVKQNAEKEPKYLPVADLVSGLRFTNQATEIHLRGELSLDTVEKLMKSFPVARPEKERK